jgi:hypothetical protein
MKKLNSIVVLFCISFSLPVFSQIGNGGFKIEDEDPMDKVLLSFDAIFDNTKVELTWSSDTEKKNNYYTIEKSKDATNFESVTTIRAFGNNSNIISYFDVDYSPYEGISYYRLTQIDAKGSLLSSRLVSINNKNSTESLAINQSGVYDTPSNLMGSENREVLVVLRSEKGIESYSKVFVDPNNNVLPSDETAKLDMGTYTVVASSDNKLFSQKVVVK